MKKKHTDAEIITGIQSSGALRRQYSGILYELYFDFIYAGVKRYKLSFEDAHDAYGDAIIKVCKHIQEGKFEGKSKISTYLFRAFSNRCVDKIRSNASYIMQEDIATHYELPSPARSILEEMEQNEQMNTVFQAMEELGEKCKRLLLDIEYYGFSQEEVAKNMGYNKAATVANMKYRCLKRLKEILQIKATGKS